MDATEIRDQKRKVTSATSRLGRDGTSDRNRQSASWGLGRLQELRVQKRRRRDENEYRVRKDDASSSVCTRRAKGLRVGGSEERERERARKVVRGAGKEERGGSGEGARGIHGEGVDEILVLRTAREVVPVVVAIGALLLALAGVVGGEDHVLVELTKNGSAVGIVLAGGGVREGGRRRRRVSMK